MRKCAILLLVAVLSARSTIVIAWGGQGHRLVARLAAERLSIVARQNVEWLIGPQTLADVASWADRYELGNYQTFYWHFVDMPSHATAYDRDRDCPRQPTVAVGSGPDKWRDCIVERIPYNEQRLADTALDRADRAIALKFLVHFLGDIHQPFHALDFERGGNGIPVVLFGSEMCGGDPARPNPCNLHSVWDSGLIAHRALEDEQYLAALNEKIRADRLGLRAGGAPPDWAMESLALAKAALVAPHARIDESYYRRHITIVDERLALAGLRLASVLDRSLTVHPPGR
jgi:hypothetical protein